MAGEHTSLFSFTKRRLREGLCDGSFGGPSSESSDSMEVADGPPEEQVGICDRPWDDEEGDYDHV